MKCYQQIAINVSWPHFSWPTLYSSGLQPIGLVYSCRSSDTDQLTE